MLSSARSRLLCFSAAASLLLAGCSTISPVEKAIAAKGKSGSTYGGQQPISGASVQLYAVGTSGDGSAAAPLFTRPVLSDANGIFDFTGAYACPSPSTLVYITATGGNPSPAITNPEIALMAAIGPCGSLTSSTFININEITTVAAVYPLAPFLSSFSAIGSSSADAAALASAFTSAGYFADISTGETPGVNLPANYSVPVAQINTIADILAACINSPGGVSGDTSVCGMIFALTLPQGTAAPTDTIAALRNLALNPTLNTAALYNLIPPVSPFQPTQPIVPPDLALRLVANSAFVVSPSAVAFAPAIVNFTQPTQVVTVTNGTSTGVNITSATITGTNASDFALVPQPGSDCAITVPANTACTFQISFTPSAPGGRAAYFILGNTSANPSIAVALSGSATAGSAGPVTLTPSGLAFSQLGIPQTLTLTNSGATPLSINSIQISSTAYTQTNTCGSSLPAASSCTINVSVPGPLTAASATLTVVDDASGGPQTASLSFTGSAGASFAPVVGFGHWAIGATGSQYVTITGPGVSGSLNFTITGPNAADFSFNQNSSVLSTSCTYDYRSQITCTFGIFYKPSALVTSTAYVNIAGVGRFTLTGTGDPAGVDFDLFQGRYGSQPGYAAPITSLNLGSTPIGAPATSSFAIANTGTVSPLTLNAPVFSGPNAAEFTVSVPTCSSVCYPVITFTPIGTGLRSATLTYTDTTGAVTRTLAVTGNGTTPAPVLTAPTNLQFSNVPLGTVSASQTITVNAYQNHPIQASLTSIFSGGPQPFIFTSPSFCPSTPCTLSIAYAPTSSNGSPSANVWIVATDTVGLSTQQIQAYGQVAPLADVSFNPMNLVFAAQAIDTVSAPQTVTFTNTGTTVLMLTFGLTDTGGAPDFTLDNHCPTSLAINATCTVSVSFAPVDNGYPHTNLEIYGSNVTRYVDLLGSTP